MSDTPTDVPGASLRRINGSDYVVVRLNVMFPGPPPTINGLAQRLALQPEAVFNALLNFRSNGQAVTGIYRGEVGDPVPDLATARLRLRSRGTIFTASDQFPNGTQTPYIAWGVRSESDTPVVLPFSLAFREVMRRATEQRQRELRVRGISPAMEALRRELLDLRIGARTLESDINLANALAATHARDLALLEALDGMLGAMLAFPKASVSAADRSDVERLRGQLLTLKNEGYRHMILEPPDQFRAGLIARRGQEAAALRAAVEAQALRDHIQTMVNNRDIVPSDLWTDAYDVVRYVFQVLLGSPEADAVLTAHVLPMIQQIAGRPLDLAGLSAPHRPEFDAAVRQVATPGSSDSVLLALTSFAGAFLQTAGNYPGPNTLAVSLMEIAAPLLMGRVMGNPTEAGRMGAVLYRALASAAGLRQAERVILMEAIDQGDLAALRRVQWSSRFMNSGAWGAAVAVAGAICFLAAITTDDANTLRRWANILGSASGTALGVAVAVQRWSTLIEQGIVRGVGGRVLGVIGGMASVVSGTLTAVEEYQTGDSTGTWIAAGGAVGGALTVAGFLIGAGAGTSATVAGAPIGVVLMAVGAIIGIGAAVISVVRALVTAGSQLVFEAFINEFGRRTPFVTAAAARPTLQAAFTAVQSAHHPVDFWDVNPDKCAQLFDLGFSAAHITQIVNENDANVQTRLRQSQRI